MDASRCTLIKTMLVRNGPKTLQQLYVSLLKTFPEQFKGVSRHKFKRSYLKNLKEYKQIQVKVTRDPDVIAKLQEDPDSRVLAGSKEAWLFKIDDSLISKYTSGEVDININHSEILEKIEASRVKSKDFWEGNAKTPYDWKTALKSAGDKTSL